MRLRAYEFEAALARTTTGLEPGHTPNSIIRAWLQRCGYPLALCQLVNKFFNFCLSSIGKPLVLARSHKATFLQNFP